MYCKRILILQQTDKRFAARNKELCGMVKLVNNLQNVTEITVFVTNANVDTFGEWWLLLALGRFKTALQLTTLNNEKLTLPRQSLDNVSCLLVKREDKCFDVARAFVGEGSLCEALSRQKEGLIQAAIQSEQASTPYEQFIASTNDYYEGLDVKKLRADADGRYQSVKEYSTAFERFYATGAGCDYYQSVKDEITKVFVKFPPYYPLIRKYRESFFVRIDFPSSDKYFVLGALQRKGKIRYICYGLPADNDGLTDKDFVYVQNSPTSFWMLFQDADTGQITVLDEKI